MKIPAGFGKCRIMQLFGKRMGNTLAQPDTNKNIRSFKFEGRSGAVVGMQGWRPSMEVGE